MSDGLSQAAVWLSGLMPVEQASQVLQRFAQVNLPTTTLWEQLQQQGERLRDFVAVQQERVGVERTRWEAQQYQAHWYRSVEMDGGMVHIRGEGWKELKVGLVSGVEQGRQNGQATVRLVDSEYTAVIGDVSRFGSALWELAVKQAVPYAGHTAVTADGAAWIWRLCRDLFPCSTQIVDWYHARQHLSQAALARYPSDESAAQHWFHSMSAALFAGEVWKIIADLQAHGCPEPSTYFRTHKRRMQYVTFRAEGFPIGSGGIESGIKQYKQRLCAAGMRWSRVGAERMVVIRSAVLSNSFDALWTQAA